MKKGTDRRFGRKMQAFSAAAVIAFTAGQAQSDTVTLDEGTWDNPGLISAYGGIGVGWVIGGIFGLVPEPITSIPGELAQYSFELSLKGLPPVFEPPEPLPETLEPNTADQCHFKFVMPLASAGFSNFVGLFNVREHVGGGFTWTGEQSPDEVVLAEVNEIEACLTQDAGQSSALRLRSMCNLPQNNWGIIGHPRLYHLFSDARATVTSFTGGIGGLDEPQVVSMPAGVHNLDWTATTETNLLADVIIPPVLMSVMVYAEAKIGKYATRLDELKGRNAAGRVRFIDEQPVKLKEIADAEAAARRAEFFNNWVLGNFDIKLGRVKVQDALSLIGMDSVVQDVSIDYASGLLTEPITTAGRFESTQISVYDVIPPEIEFSQAENDLDSTRENGKLQLEATDFGGVRTARVYQNLLDLVEASDACGRDFNLVMAAKDSVTGELQPLPYLLPIDEDIEIVWTVTDHGPNLPVDRDTEANSAVPRTSDGRYTRSLSDLVSVADTQAPILKAPPGRVFETLNAPPEAGRDLDDLDLGNAMVVDLADPSPVLGNNSTGYFPTGSRTTVTWSATDASGNQSTDEQLITVKEAGTNTAPRARNRNARTLTSDPVDIVLQGIDNDLIDGRYDPLAFAIEEQPENGEFIAPLYPFFIDDYRSIRPPAEGEDDGGFYEAVTSSDVSGWLENEVCGNDDLTDEEKDAEIDKLRTLSLSPLFVHVEDDGTRYVLDSEFDRDCGSSSSSTFEYQRISKWDPEGAFIDSLIIDILDGDFSIFDEKFDLVGDGWIYYTNEILGEQISFNLERCRADFELVGEQCEQVSRIEHDTFAPDNALISNNMSSAVHDPDTGLTFATDARNIAIISDEDEMLGTLPEGITGDDEFLNDSCNRPNPPVPWPAGGAGRARNIGFGMTLGEDGSLYIADSCASRVHKFTKTLFDENGNLVIGEHVGWMGKCLRSTNKACDVDNQRSRGFSCTDETCFVNQCLDEDCNTTSPDEDPWGDKPGQFNLPLDLVFDPNEVLYVADYFNIRVQRFGVDGTFAGEAQSNENGTVDPTKPSFVLGNMPAPRAIAVNSTQFFVTDQKEEFVHIFGTLPFKDITDDSAVVTYVSHDAFHSDTDQFTYTVDDGLEESGPATVSIRVNRNFRRPEAFPGNVIALEDVPLGFQLEADDPDGIAGVDFNGLDTLTWEITRQPRDGEATLMSDGRVLYESDPEFFGTDRIKFRVHDGRRWSNTAQVDIEIIKQNDPPVVSFEDRRVEVGLGLPVLFKGRFTDDTNFDHTARVDWGDGNETLPGELVTDEDEETNTMTGVVLNEPGWESEGATFATHTYEVPGQYTITIEVTDGEGAVGFAQHNIEVLPLSEMNVGVDVPDREAMDGAPFAYTVEIEASDPTVGSGVVAEDLVYRAELDEQLTLLGVELLSIGSVGTLQNARGTASQDINTQAVGGSDCYVDGSELRCDIAALAPGEVARIGIAAVSDGIQIYDTYPNLFAVLKTDTPSTTPYVESFFDIDLRADPTDSDGDGMTDMFEKAFGLNPAVDDADGDKDGDGLNNLREYENRTDAGDPDTDGDGLSDGEEIDTYFTDANDPDTDGDEMPDGWEVENNLDPFEDDADQDPDRDQFTNLEEFQAGTNPNNYHDNPAITVPVMDPKGMILLTLLFGIFAARTLSRRQTGVA